MLKDGTYVKADAVVCNADLPWAYNNLLPQTPYAKKVDKLDYTASTISFYWYYCPCCTQPNMNERFLTCTLLQIKGTGLHDTAAGSAQYLPQWRLQEVV